MAGVNPVHDPEVQHFESLSNLATQCLHDMRLLRQTMLGTHDFVSNKIVELLNRGPTTSLEIKSNVEKSAKQMTDEYDKLESDAKQFPLQTPNAQIVNKLNSLLIECTTGSDDVYDKIIDAFAWGSDTSKAYIDYVLTMLKSHSHYIPRWNKLSIIRELNMRHNPVAEIQMPQITQRPTNSAQRRFELEFMHVMNHYDSKLTFGVGKIRLFHRFIEKSAMSSIIELKVAAVLPSNPKYHTPDKQAVGLLKMAILINNGLMDYIQFIAPSEEWTYTETCGQKIIDFGTESKYELYQRFSIQANMMVNHISGSGGDNRPIWPIIQFLIKYTTYDQPCRFCKKVLRDFSPAIFDANRKFSFHMGCK